MATTRTRQSRSTSLSKTFDDLPDDDQQALLLQHKRKLSSLLAAEKIAKEAVRRGFAIAKQDGLTRKNLTLAIELTSGDGGKARAEAERVAKVARWVGVPLGTQLGMFSDDGDRHFDAGRRAALDDEPCRPPRTLSQPDAQRWMEGHSDGVSALNATRSRRFRPMSEAVHAAA